MHFGIAIKPTKSLESLLADASRDAVMLAAVQNAISLNTLLIILLPAVGARARSVALRLEKKSDRELCTAAVAQCGIALRFVSDEMKGDRELCTAALA